MNDVTDIRREILDDITYQLDRLMDNTDYLIEYWGTRCLKAEDELSEITDKYEELVKGTKK